MIEELKRFSLVAKKGNLTKVANEIFITQSALTQSITRLEKALTTKLFTHNGRTLKLTTDGESVLLLSDKILGLWEKAKNPGIRMLTLPTLNVGLYDNAALRLGSFIQKKIQQGSINIELTIDKSELLFSLLRLGILDLAICVQGIKTERSQEFTLVKTFSEELLPISAFLLNKSISKLPFIFYNKGSMTRAQTDLFFTKMGISPRIFAESTSPDFIKELAILGCGVALLPKNFVETEIKQNILKVHKMPVKFTRKYGIYINKNADLNENHPFIKEIIDALSKK